MTTPDDYGKAAAEARTLAERVKPPVAPAAAPGANLVTPAGARFDAERNLIVYHLRTAATKLQAIAAAVAEEERKK